MKKQIFVAMWAVVLAMMCVVNIFAEEKGTNRWIIGNYVDKFDRPTGEQYITNEYWIYGTFSNSATTDSELKVELRADRDGVYFVLYEYGDTLVKNYYSKESHYSLYILDEKEEEHILDCCINPQGANLCANDKDEFCRILEEGGETIFYIKEKDGMSEYKFTVNLPKDFSDAYSEIGGEFQNNKGYKKYLEEEEAKHISGEVQISLKPKDQVNLEYMLSSEIPDGTIIKLLLFKNYYFVEETDQKVENGKITWTFEKKMEDAVCGDKFEVDAKIVYEDQSEVIQQKLGKGAFQEFYYLDGVKSESDNGQEVASLDFITYTVE